MRLLLGTLIFILVVVIPSRGTDVTNAESGPHLIVSSVNGILEIDRPGTIWLDIKNDANISAVDQNSSVVRQLPAWLQPGYGTNISDALGVSAELLPKDARFEMLTGPQIVGSLESGKNRTVEFNLRTDGTAVPGIYPVDLSVTYSKLSVVQTSRDPEQPDVTFQYENISKTFSEDVNVVQGPRISVEEVKDSVLTGTKSELNLIFANNGDLPALDLRAQVLPQHPFRSGDGSFILGSLEPGRSATARFMIITENGTVPGVYALQIGVDYRDSKIMRKEEMAAIVPVKVQSGTLVILVPAAVASVLAVAVYVIVKTYQVGSRRKRKRRW